MLLNQFMRPAVLLLALVGCGQAMAETTEEALDRLLGKVAQSDCIFIRNGTEHDAADAADHLRLKSRRGKKYYDSIDQFIDRLATKSSWSGKLYMVRCPGEELQPSSVWLHMLLDEDTEQEELSPA